MRNRVLALAAMGLFFAREICAQEAYASMRTLIVRAIDLPTAHIQGVVVGPIADRFTKQFLVATPLLVEAWVVKDFSADCKRLALKFTKKDVPTPNGLVDLPLTMELNSCHNGQPPSAGMDLLDVARAVGRPRPDVGQ